MSLTSPNSAYYNALVCTEKNINYMKEYDIDALFEKRLGKSVYTQHIQGLRTNIDNIGKCIQEATYMFSDITDKTQFQIDRMHDDEAGKIVTLTWCNKARTSILSS